MNFLKMNESAVSPIVATLVLIVVAVVGAVAVGTIMGTFSNDVSEQTNVGDVGGAASTEILIAGSTTVQPVSELLAESYMKAKQGVKVTVQGGGSGAGIASAGMGIVDIGAASKYLPDADAAKYPDMKEYVIGGSAVVFIVNENCALTEVDKADLLALYQSGTAIGDVNKAYQRAEASGTEDTVSKYLTGSEGKVDEWDTESATGNAGILAAIRGNDAGDAIGFVDAGYAFGASGVTILDITETDGEGVVTSYETSSPNIINALKGDETAYPNGLTRPLVYLVNGNPSSVVKDFINFAQSPGAIEQFHVAGMYSAVEFL